MRIGTPNLDFSTWADEDLPIAGSQTEQNSGRNGNWLKVDGLLNVLLQASGKINRVQNVSSGQNEITYATAFSAGLRYSVLVIRCAQGSPPNEIGIGWHFAENPTNTGFKIILDDIVNTLEYQAYAF